MRPHVSIDRFDDRILFNPYLPAWSYQSIGSLPPLLSFKATEAEVFDQLAHLAGVSVHQDGTVIRLVADNTKLLASSRVSHLLVEFDTRYGGMITRYHFETSYQAMERHVVIDWQIDWANKNGHVIPVRRMAEMEAKNNGKLIQQDQSDITFKTFQIEKVQPLEISLNSMGIAAGTPVVDSTIQTQWRYEPSEQGP